MSKVQPARFLKMIYVAIALYSTMTVVGYGFLAVYFGLRAPSIMQEKWYSYQMIAVYSLGYVGLVCLLWIESRRQERMRGEGTSGGTSEDTDPKDSR